jgi:hypothetical protein
MCHLLLCFIFMNFCLFIRMAVSSSTASRGLACFSFGFVNFSTSQRLSRHLCHFYIMKSISISPSFTFPYRYLRVFSSEDSFGELMSTRTTLRTLLRWAKAFVIALVLASSWVAQTSPTILAYLEPDSIHIGRSDKNSMRTWKEPLQRRSLKTRLRMPTDLTKTSNVNG